MTEAVAGAGRPQAPRRTAPRWLAVVLLIVAVTAGAGLRGDALRHKTNVQHDEAWSYVSASGHLGQYVAAANGGLTGRWVPAGQWRHLWSSSDLGSMADIGPDLARYDVHPPLYFDLLHVWLMLTGMHVWSGPALNIVLSALAALALYGLGRGLGFEPIEAALVTLVWSLSPAVLIVSSMARQYDLLALFTILFVWALWRVTAPAARLPWAAAVGLAAATAAGFLTHYQFVLVIGGGVLVAAARPALRRRTVERGAAEADAPSADPGPSQEAARRSGWTYSLWAAAGLVAGLAVAAVVQPGFTAAFGREKAHVADFARATVAAKAAAIGDTFGRFFGFPPLWALIAGAILVVVIVATIALPGPRAGLVRRLRGARPGWYCALSFLLVTAGGIAAQNLLSLSVPPIISARYFAMAWPFLAFVPLLVFGLAPRWRLWLTGIFCAAVLLPAALVGPLLYQGVPPMPINRLANATAVVTDAPGAGELPRYLWYVPSDTPVFAGTQAQVAAALERPAASPGSRLYYVSVVGAGNSWRGRRAVLARMARLGPYRRVARLLVAAIYEDAVRGDRVLPKPAP